MTNEIQTDQGEQDDPDEIEEDRPPRFLLVIATLMIFVAVAAYVFEEELFDVFFSSNLFVAGLLIPVAIALLCLYLYTNASFGGGIGARKRRGQRRSSTAGGVSYNVYGGQTAGDVKAKHGRRKSARHLRKQLARNTPHPGELASPDDDEGNDEDET